MDINVIIASTVGLFVITLLLVTMLLFAKAKLLPSGPVKLIINGEKNIQIEKIITEKKARKLNPNYFLVTPWGFIKEFVKRESSWLKKGGRFIIPFPKFKLIK